MWFRKLSLYSFLVVIINVTILFASKPSFAEDNIYANESCSDIIFVTDTWVNFPKTTEYLDNIFQYFAIVNFNKGDEISDESKAAASYFNVNPKTIEGVQIEKLPSKDKVITYYRPLINAINDIPNYFRDDLSNKKYDIYNLVEIYSFIAMLPGFYKCYQGINNQLDKLGTKDKINLSLINERFLRYSTDYIKNHENEIAAYSDEIINANKITVKKAFSANKVTSVILYDNAQLFIDTFRNNPELRNKISNAHYKVQQAITQINYFSDKGQVCMVADNNEAVQNLYRNDKIETENDIYEKLIPTNNININFVALFDVDAQGMPHNITFKPKVEGKYFEGGDIEAQNNISVMTEYINAFNYVPGLKDCKPYAVKGKHTFSFQE